MKSIDRYQLNIVANLHSDMVNEFFGVPGKLFIPIQTFPSVITI